MYYAVALKSSRDEILASKGHITMREAAHIKLWMIQCQDVCHVALCKAASSFLACDKAAKQWGRYGQLAEGYEYSVPDLSVEAIADALAAIL